MIYLLLIALFLPAPAAYACLGETSVRHINPDNSEGGLVSVKSRIGSNVYIAPSAMVCGQAWVDSNSFILDQAVVSEDAWIKSFVVVKENSRISGHAVLAGVAKNMQTIVEGKTRIHGNVKILKGSKIAGNSEIFGSPILENTKVSGQSKVCDGYFLQDENLFDSTYFCGASQETSRSSISLKSKKDVLFRGLDSNIILESSLDDFILDKNVFKIFLNGILLEQHEFNIQGKYVRFNPSQLVSGLNQIEFIGRDIFGKKMESEELSFFAGGNTVQLTDVKNAVFGDITVTSDEEVYLIKPVFYNGMWILENIPDSFLNSQISFTIATSFGFLYYNGLIQDIPVSLDFIPYAVPSAIDNNDFSLGLEGWDVSHPEYVSVSHEDGAHYLQIQEGINEVVELKRTYKVNQKVGIKFDFKSINFPLVANEIQNADVIFISRKTGKSYLKSFSYGSALPLDISDFFLLNELINDEITFIIRIHPTELSFYEGAKISVEQKPLDSLAKLDFVSPAFYLYVGDTRGIANDVINIENCENSIFDYKYGPIKKSFITTVTVGGKKIESILSPMRFLSVGSSGLLPSGIKNRLYANFQIKGVKKSEIESIKINITSPNGVFGQYVDFDLPLGVCASEFLKEDLNDEFNWKAEYNAVKFVAELSTADMMKFSTVDEGSVKLKPIVTLKTGLILEGNTSKVAMLRSTDNILTYGKTDWYSSVESGMVRTGGDKWAKPLIANRIEELLNGQNTVPWRMNDGAKLNGGPFPIHSTHMDGLDADISFEKDVSRTPPTPKLDLSKAPIESGVLENIQNFLYRSRDSFKYFRDIYITAPNNSEAYNFFHYRCIAGKRFINLDTLNNGQGSLLLNRNHHLDHLHLRFHDPLYSNGERENQSPSFFPEAKLFKFGYDELTKELDISPLDPVAFSNTSIYWRVHDIHEHYQPRGFVKFGRHDFKAEKNNARNESYTYDKYAEYEGPFFGYISLVNKKGYGGCSGNDFSTNASPTFVYNTNQFCRNASGNIDDWLIHESGEGFKSLDSIIAPNVTVNIGSSVCNGIDIPSGYIHNSKIEGDIEVPGSVAFTNSTIQGSGIISGLLGVENSHVNANFDIDGKFTFRNTNVYWSPGIFLNIISKPSGPIHFDEVFNSEIYASITNTGHLTLNQVNLSGNLTVTGRLTANNVKILGPLSISGTVVLHGLEVKGNTTFNGMGFSRFINSDLENVTVVNNITGGNDIRVENSNLKDVRLEVSSGEYSEISLTDLQEVGTNVSFKAASNARIIITNCIIPDGTHIDTASYGSVFRNCNGGIFVQ